MVPQLLDLVAEVYLEDQAQIPLEAGHLQAPADCSEEAQEEVCSVAAALITRVEVCSAETQL